MGGRGVAAGDRGLLARHGAKPFDRCGPLRAWSVARCGQDFGATRPADEGERGARPAPEHQERPGERRAGSGQPVPAARRRGREDRLPPAHAHRLHELARLHSGARLCGERRQVSLPSRRASLRDRVSPVRPEGCGVQGARGVRLPADGVLLPLQRNGPNRATRRRRSPPLRLSLRLGTAAVLRAPAPMNGSSTILWPKGRPGASDAGPARCGGRCIRPSVAKGSLARRARARLR